MGRLLPLGLLCAALVAACGADRQRPPAAPTPAGGQPASPSPASVAEGARPLVEQALTDAAARVGVPRDQIRVVRVEPRDWPDSALGCPRPGLGYAQVITPGYLIVLEAGGQTLDYHTDLRRAELCQR